MALHPIVTSFRIGRRGRLCQLVCAAVLSGAMPELAVAAATVGNGTPESCTSIVLRRAMADGGSVNFNCGPAPVVIDFDRCTTVSSNLTLEGAGRVTLRNVDVCATARFFTVTATGSLTLDGMTLSEAAGTAIRNDGTLVVENSLLLGNGSPATEPPTTVNGGAILNDGTLSVSNSAFVNNRTTGKGGAIFASEAAKTTILNTTFVGNSASSGGALFVSRGLVVNSTFVGNRAAVDGGAFSNPRLASPGVAVRNSLMAGNPSGDAMGNCTPTGLPDFVLPSVIDGGGNFQFPGTACGATIPSVDPQLLPAGYYGGRTIVAPLAANSPVADAGVTVSCLPDDQRGRSRNRVSAAGGPVCSPGAVEASPTDVDPVQTAIEYYYAARDHYFLTPLAAEIQALDSGRFPGWVRTGSAFSVYVDSGQDLLGTTPVCRLYGRPEAGLDSHFFSATPQECQAVIDRFSAAWILETDALFEMQLPDAGTGVCPAGTDPVYRLFNNRTDVNHRYTTSTETRAGMVGQGWIAEGLGADGGVWCAAK